VVSEEDAWKKRQEEAKEAGTSNAIGEWKWTLNWDAIDDNIIVGSCPRSVEDVDRLVEEANIEAIICLQSDACFEALEIDWNAIRDRAVDRGVVMSRVAVRDFDHNDQANMLPEAVRVLAGHLMSGRRTYVHCTAGINRATLTVVGYLCMYKGMDLEEAVPFVKSRRPCAHPYVDCFKTASRRLLEGRGEELMGISRAIYEDRERNGVEGNSDSDWKEAEIRLARETFDRRLKIDAITATSLSDISTSTLKGAAEQLEETRKVYDKVTAELERNRKVSEEATAHAEELADQLLSLKRSIASSAKLQTDRANAAEKVAQASTALAQELQIELGDLKDELNRMRNTQTKAQMEKLTGMQNTVQAQIRPCVQVDEAQKTWDSLEVPFSKRMEGMEIEGIGENDPLFEFCLDNPEWDECKVFYDKLKQNGAVV